MVPGMRTPGRLAVVLLALVGHNRAIRLSWIRLLRRLAWGTDPLAPRSKALSGSALTHPVLASSLRDAELGTWSLGPKSLMYVEAAVAEIRPRVVLEFGSGVSTVCVAQFLRDQEDRHNAAGGRLISVEQSHEQAGRTEERLMHLGLTDRVEILVAPLEEREIDGRIISAYRLSEQELTELLGGDDIDLVIIDGPAAESGARYGTLPLLRNHLRRGATILLDDALRDGELDVIAGWSTLDYIAIDGLVPIEHGLMRGRALRPLN